MMKLFLCTGIEVVFNFLPLEQLEGSCKIFRMLFNEEQIYAIDCKRIVQLQFLYSDLKYLLNG